MKKTALALLSIVMVFSSCQKEDLVSLTPIKADPTKKDTSQLVEIFIDGLNGLDLKPVKHNYVKISGKYQGIEIPEAWYHQNKIGDGPTRSFRMERRDDRLVISVVGVLDPDDYCEVKVDGKTVFKRTLDSAIIDGFDYKNYGIDNSVEFSYTYSYKK